MLALYLHRILGSEHAVRINCVLYAMSVIIPPKADGSAPNDGHREHYYVLPITVFLLHIQRFLLLLKHNDLITKNPHCFLCSFLSMYQINIFGVRLECLILKLGFLITEFHKNYSIAQRW